MVIRIWQEGDVFSAIGEDSDFSCCKCSHIVQPAESGFACKVHKEIRIFCEGCQNLENRDSYNNEPAKDNLCKIALLRDQEHQHIRFTRKK